MSEPNTGLRFRVYLDGELADEGWVYTGDADDDATIARLSRMTEQAHEAGRYWRLEVYDPDQPIGDDNPLIIDADSFAVPVMVATITVRRSRPFPYGHPN